MNDFQINTFYRFKNISNIRAIKDNIEEYIKEFDLKGTILLAREGINGSISGKERDLKKVIKFIKKILNIRKLEIKVNDVEFLPFNRIKIRLKKEIVALGKKKYQYNQTYGY